MQVQVGGKLSIYFYDTEAGVKVIPRTVVPARSKAHVIEVVVDASNVPSGAHLDPSMTLHTPTFKCSAMTGSNRYCQRRSIDDFLLLLFTQKLTSWPSCVLQNTRSRSSASAQPSHGASSSS